jgi:hypothetical protein
VKPLCKKIWRLLKNLNINLPYDPAILFMGIYPKECDTHYPKGTCTPMFIASLFTIAKIWKQRRCPTIEEWIKEMWYLYTTKFYSAMKKNEILSYQVTRLSRPKILCSPSYADFRSIASAAMWLDLGHMIKVEHSREVWE